MELESYKNGTLLYIGAEAGQKIQVNELLCIIGEKDKVDVDAIVAATKGNAGAPASSGAKAEQKTETKQEETKEASGEAASTSTENGRVKASPLARKLAKEKGLDISKVPGSGDGGRIVKSDVDNYKPSSTSREPARTAETVRPACNAGRHSRHQLVQGLGRPRRPHEQGRTIA